MKRSKRRIFIPALAFCLLAATLYALLSRNPYRRLDRYSNQMLRLATNTNRHTLSDHLIVLLHRGQPYQYYAERSQQEQEALLASGYLVETNLSLPESWSKSELIAALNKTSGVYWALARLDTTNHLARFICKPHQVVNLRQALRNE